MKVTRHEIQGLANNEKKTQKLVFERLYPVLLSVAKRYTGEEMLSEDAVTASFIKAFKRADEVRYNNEYTFYAWIKRILINQVIADLRQHKKFLDIDTFSERLTANENDMVLAGLQAKQLMSMVEYLPVNMRTVFMLYVVEDYQHNEIAEMLNISENNSKVLLYRAKNTLKNYIQNEVKITRSNGTVES